MTSSSSSEWPAHISHMDALRAATSLPADRSYQHVVNQDSITHAIAEAKNAGKVNL